MNLASFVLTKPGFELLKKVAKKVLIKLGLRKEHHAGYNEWIKDRLDPAVLKKEFDSVYNSLKVKPKISIVVPVYNPQIDYLTAAIHSVTDQSYKNWELCISDDRSPNPDIKSTLARSSLKKTTVSR